MQYPKVSILATAAVIALMTAASLGAQADSTRRSKADKTFFTKRDLVVVGAAVAATGLTAIFDERIATWSQSSGVQGSDSRRDRFETITTINEVPLTLGAAATFAVARLAGWKTVADAGLHATEALALTVVTAELIRVPLGRARPRQSGNAFTFSPGSGLSKFEYRSYPSIHSAAAFAAAAAVTGEVRVHSPKSVKYVAPVLYTAALVPGITRIYLHQHWASDVVAGGILGAWLGAKVVGYAHTHNRSRLDRMLLGLSAMPDGRGGGVVGVSFVP
jgi:membrane-associated phospholipid phosphatase